MKIGVVGCGYVFDTYMNTLSRHEGLEVAGVADLDAARLAAVGKHFKLRTFDSTQALLAQEDIGLIVNLTSIDSHYDVTKAALRAGKHVYSEKPFTTDLSQARELLSLADALNLRLSGAPCNAMSNTVQTMWRAIRDGAVGRPLVVYAEVDDNPIYLMEPETWRNPSGAPWPYVDEYESGCTFEHAGYYLGWLAAMFGPAKSVTAFSKRLVANKTVAPLARPDTPDFSVACIEFESGVSARLTCSIVAPFDQRLRVIGDEGELSVNTYRDYDCPVRLERFSSLSLNARKARWVRELTPIGRLFGVGGRKVTLLRGQEGSRRPSRFRDPVRALKAAQLGVQDKCLGVAEMAAAIEAGRPPWLTPEFILHVTELTLEIQRAGPEGASRQLTTRFTPLKPLAFADDTHTLKLNLKTGLADQVAGPVLRRLHAH